MPRPNFVDRVVDDKVRDFQIVSSDQTGPKRQSLAKPDPGATPFKVVIDPKVRMELRRLDQTKFLFASRGFHWIQEYPFNR